MITPFVFNNPTNIAFTQESGDFILDKLSDLNPASYAIITDEIMSQQVFFKNLVAQLQEFEVKPLIFNQVLSDACISDVENISRSLINKSCDLIIAIGGGSVIDTAKLVNVSISHNDLNILDYQGVNLIAKPLKPLWIIPTTAGTGSEVSLVAVAKETTTNKKIFFASPHIAGHIALLDPNAIVSLPKFLTAATGFDALTHAIEAYCAINCNSSLTDALAIESAKILFEYLPIAYNEPTNIEARGKTLIASTMAGIAFSNSGVGVIHALAHSVGAMFKTHHGATNALFLEHGIRFNAKLNNELYERFSKNVFNDNNATTETLISKIIELKSKFNLPFSLKDLKIEQISDKIIHEIADIAQNDPSLMFNPSNVEFNDLVQLINDTK